MTSSRTASAKKLTNGSRNAKKRPQKRTTRKTVASVDGVPSVVLGRTSLPNSRRVRIVLTYNIVIQQVHATLL
jgi:hypothetical protein